MTASVRALVLASATVVLLGCATPSGSTYDAGDVGRSIQTAHGTVVSSRPVHITGETNAWGPAAGGALGGAGSYGAFGSGWATIIGGVVGAGIGYVAQQALNDRSGIEYIVQMDDGRMVTVVQNRDSSGEMPLPPGTPVLVQISGKYNRIIADPRGAAAPTGAGASPPEPAPTAGTADTPGQSAATTAATTAATSGTPPAVSASTPAATAGDWTNPDSASRGGGATPR